MTNTDPATVNLEDYDPSLPTFEIWLDGTRFASTQLPARAKAMLATMTGPSSAKRYGNRTVELKVVNDRRSADRT